MKKMDFEAVDHVFIALLEAFHPEGAPEEGADAKFIALWTLFLATSGWEEDEYFTAVENHEYDLTANQSLLEDDEEIALPLIHARPDHSKSN